MPPRLLTAIALLVLTAACAGASTSGGSPTTAAAPTATTAPADTPTERAGVPEGSRLEVRVVERRTHDDEAFTQGLEFDAGRLFESRGLYGESAMTEIDPATGAVLDRHDLAEEFFGEGATVVDDRVIQITWREQTAFVYDADTLEVAGTHTYTGEGWGICDEPDRLVMSDGSSTLTFRDRTTFAPLGTVAVTRDGQPVERLNELECVDGLVWANVWQTDELVVIDPADGEVVATVDASGLLTEQEAAQADVLNGIAYDPVTDTWLITGKQWPWMFAVEFDCVGGCEGADVVQVLAGPGRIQTAIAIARDAYPAGGSAAAAVLAREDDFADALAGTPLAAAVHGPLLLSHRHALTADTAAELLRALPDGATAFLLGGPAALSEEVAAAVADLGFDVQRLAGPSRFETAVAVADAVVAAVGEVEHAFLATGLDFPNALVAGAAAGTVSGVLLLSVGRSAHEATMRWLLTHPLVEQHAVGADAIAAHPTARAWGGEDPYATAVDLAAFSEPLDARVAALASGVDFPDALAGGAHAAGLGTALVLTEPVVLTAVTEAWLRDQAARLDRVVVYGGDRAVSPDAWQAAGNAVSGGRRTGPPPGA